MVQRDGEKKSKNVAENQKKFKKKKLREKNKKIQET